MNWKYLGALVVVVGFGCGESAVNATTGGNGGAGGDCWYCVGSGGSTAATMSATTSGKTTSGKATSGKATSGGGKDGVVITYSGSLNTKTGEGKYSYSVASGDQATLCDVSYSIVGATVDPSCVSCTFAYTMPLSAPVVTVGGADCGGNDMLDGKEVRFGHTDPATLMFFKEGSYTPLDAKLGDSQVMGDEWVFGLSYSGGGK